MNQNKSYRTAFIFVTILFFLWGFITVLVDSLIPRLRELFTLTYFEAGLVQFAFFGAYFLLSVPAGFLLARIGYKKGIILGLCTMAVGCLVFYPAASLREFWIFGLGYFTLAAGITILQVAANPYVTLLGSEQTASSRLNLSQAFNSLGTAIAPTLGALFILSDKILTTQEINFLSEAERETYYIGEAAAVQTPFIGIAIFIALIAVFFAFVKLPRVQGEAVTGGYGKVLRNKNLLLGALGLFFYVGAEVALGSYLVNYFITLGAADLIRESGFMSTIAGWLLSENSMGSDMAIVGVFVTFYWSGAMIGRFVGSYLTRLYAPAKVLMVFAISAVSLLLISQQTTGLLAMWAILAVGLFNSIMFPTIFSLALNGLGNLKAQGSGVLVSMIVGGAIIPPTFGFLTDSFGFNVALFLVMVCYLYILMYAYRNKKRSDRLAV